MSTDHDTTRIVRSWLRTDEQESADRVLDAVLDALDTTPQRRAGWPAWRTPMNRFLTYGLGAAAVVAILFIGAQLISAPANTGGGLDATSSPDPTMSSEPTASPGLSPAGLATGEHELDDGMTVTIPAEGWFGTPGTGILIKNDTADPPDGAGLIAWSGLAEMYVYGDPCAWSTSFPERAATTVDEVITALEAQASREASAPVDISLDGYTGQAITLRVPADADFSQCDSGLFALFSDMRGTSPDSVGRYSQGPGQVDEIWVLDVDGRLAVIDWAYFDATPEEVVDEMRSIVESTTFD